MAKKPKKAPDRVRVKFQFNDGTTESLPAVEVERQLLMQYAAMATSSDPEMQILGKEALAKIAANSFKSRLDSINQSARAKGPRSLSREQEQRLLNRYEERVRDGQKYGAQKALATEFSVSVSTVKNIIGRRPG